MSLWAKPLTKLSIQTVLLLGIVILNGCQLAPLHNNELADQSGIVSNELRKVEIQPIEGRAGVRLKIALLKRGIGAQHSTITTRYTVKTTLTSSSQWVAVESITGRPSTIFYTLQATLTLTDNENQKEIFKRSLRAQASYDWSGQRFANDRAANDAEIRTVESLADQIKTLLTIELKKHGA